MNVQVKVGPNLLDGVVKKRFMFFRKVEYSTYIGPDLIYKERWFGLWSIYVDLW